MGLGKDGDSGSIYQRTGHEAIGVDLIFFQTK